MLAKGLDGFRDELVGRFDGEVHGLRDFGILEMVIEFQEDCLALAFAELIEPVFQLAFAIRVLLVLDHLELCRKLKQVFAGFFIQGLIRNPLLNRECANNFSRRHFSR